MVLNRVKLISCLSDGSKTPSQIAELLNISSDTVKNYMQSYVDIGFVDLKNGKYNITDIGCKFVESKILDIVDKPVKINPETHKFCKNCNTVKPIEEFSLDVGKKDGRCIRCKTCVAINRPKLNDDNIPIEFKRKSGTVIIDGATFPNGGFTTTDFVNENPDMFKTVESWDAKIIRCHQIINNFIKSRNVVKLGSHPRSSGGIANYYSVAQTQPIQHIYDSYIRDIFEQLRPTAIVGEDPTLGDAIESIDSNTYKLSEDIKTLIELIEADNGNFKRCFAELIAIQKKQLLLFEKLANKQQSD